jgi:hypothetical protein
VIVPSAFGSAPLRDKNLHPAMTSNRFSRGAPGFEKNAHIRKFDHQFRVVDFFALAHSHADFTTR